jgi:hypothetical protein
VQIAAVAYREVVGILNCSTRLVRHHEHELSASTCGSTRLAQIALERAGGSLWP